MTRYKSLASVVIIVAVMGFLSLVILSDKNRPSSSVTESVENSIVDSTQGEVSPDPLHRIGVQKRKDLHESNDLKLQDEDGQTELFKAVRHVENADRAEIQAKRLQELAELDPGYAQYRLMELHKSCNPAVVDHFVRTQSSGIVLEKFCEDFDPDRWPLKERDDGELSPVAEQLTLVGDFIDVMMEDVSDEKVSEVFTDLVRGSTSPELLMELLQRNLQSGDVFGSGQIWDLGQPMQERYPEADLLQAQTTALTLYRCQRFGGCGPNHMFTFIYCRNFLQGNCTPGTSVEEMIYQTTSPATYNLALEILGRL